MILSYNWQILQNPLRDKQQVLEKAKLHQPQPEDSFTSQQSGQVSINPISLKCPSFGFLFCYYIESPKVNQPEIELVPQLTLFEDQVRLKIQKSIEVENCIYLQLEVENSQIYDNLMVLNVKIRYHSQNKLGKVEGMEQLVRMAGQRQLNLYTATTYATIKREVILQSPVSAQWRQEKEGYLYLKLSKLEESGDEVEILEVEVMNWLASKEEIRKQLIKNMIKKSFKLAQKQAYALLFTIQGSVLGQQIPYYIKYRLGESQPCYKMVKHIRIYDYK